jgi:hypothetical protein
MHKKKYLATLFLLLSFLFLAFPAFADEEEASEVAGAQVTTALPEYIVPVVQVQGNLLEKEMAILKGDTVTWDVIHVAGNQGLVTEVRDILPTGLGFLPNNKLAIEFYLVKNDGTIGENITDNWVVTVSGNSFSAKTIDPFPYFFVGSSTDSRFMYRVTTVAKDNIPDGTDLYNHAFMEIENPKSKKRTVHHDRAKVYTPTVQVVIPPVPEEPEPVPPIVPELPKTDEPEPNPPAPEVPVEEPAGELPTTFEPKKEVKQAVPTPSLPTTFENLPMTGEEMLQMGLTGYLLLGFVLIFGRRYNKEAIKTYYKRWFFKR